VAPAAAIALLIAGFMVRADSQSESKPIRRILTLNEVGSTYPLIKSVDQGIGTALEKSPYRIEFYHEYMDTLMFPDPADQQRFRDFCIRKYQDRKADVIITFGSSPLRFMTESHRQSFPGSSWESPCFTENEPVSSIEAGSPPALARGVLCGCLAPMHLR
jgi:hypothetical protein